MSTSVWLSLIVRASYWWKFLKDRWWSPEDTTNSGSTKTIRWPSVFLEFTSEDGTRELVHKKKKNVRMEYAFAFIIPTGNSIRIVETIREFPPISVCVSEVLIHIHTGRLFPKTDTDPEIQTGGNSYTHPEIHR